MQQYEQSYELKDKTAIVTGAATGIGRTVAEVLAAAGARVAAGDVNVEALRDFSEASHAGRLDVSDAASVRDFFAEVESKLGGVDVLVNVAGIYPFADFETMSVETWDRVMAVNTRGVFLTCQQAVRAMKKRGGGSIVNISSVNSLKAMIMKSIHYAASKGGVNAITTTLALEYAACNIRCNAVLPGAIATAHAAKAAEEGQITGPVT